MKILFLTPYPEGKAPSQRFRFEQYFEILDREGIVKHVRPFLSEKTWDILYHHGNLWQKFFGIVAGFIKRLLLLPSVSEYDYVFIHREASPLGPPFVEWFIAKVLKKKIIYDFDDAIWLPNTSASNRLSARLKFHGKVALICKWSHKVSCGNAYLAAYARQYNGQVIINPTTVDTEHLHNPHHFHKEKKDKVTIGWTGTHSTLPYLESLHTVLKRLEKEVGYEFLVISNQAPKLNAIGSLRFQPWCKDSEIADLYQMDIGIMPLTDDQWAQGKCGFKALQYLSLGIPAVASPIGVNKDIVDHGHNGYICKTEEEWFEHLRDLILSPKKRDAMGRAGRKKIIAQYSVISNRKNFRGLFV